jgi:hypothetical protein
VLLLAAGITFSQIVLLAVLLLVILPAVTTLPIIVAFVKTYLEGNENQELGRQRRARQGRPSGDASAGRP